jgi:hypothetical protein
VGTGKHAEYPSNANVKTGQPRQTEYPVPGEYVFTVQVEEAVEPTGQ